MKDKVYPKAVLITEDGRFVVSPRHVPELCPKLGGSEQFGCCPGCEFDYHFEELMELVEFDLVPGREWEEGNDDDQA